MTTIEPPSGRDSADHPGNLGSDGQFWRRVFDAIEDPVFLCDTSFCVVLANQAYYREAGMSEADALGKPYWEVFPRGTGPLPACRTANEGGRTGSRDDVKVGSKVFLSTGYTVRHDRARQPFFLYILNDITDRKRAEEELLAAKQQLEATLDASPDLMFEVGIDGTFYSYHSPHTDLLAAPAQEFLGKRVGDILPPGVAEIAMSSLLEAHETGSSRGRQYELQLPQGRLWFELSVARKVMPAPSEPRFIVISRDITERKVAEANLTEQIEELHRWHDATLGREMRILELKHEVNELLARTGQPSRYPSAESEGQRGE